MTVWVFHGYEDDDDYDAEPIWKNIGKGKLSIYRDNIVTIANFLTMVFCEHKSDEIRLLQFIHEGTIRHNGDDYVEYNGYDWVHHNANPRGGCWKIQFDDYLAQQCVETFVDIVKNNK